MFQPTTSEENATKNALKKRKTQNVSTNYTTPDEDQKYGRKV